MWNNEIPFVSVIVPVYNGETTIGATIDSLLKQSYPLESYEILIVDNASTDTTPDIIKRYVNSSESRVKYILQSKQGVAHARNLGIQKAKGEYLIFTDDDCVADTRWIENMVKTFIDFNAQALQGKIVLATDIPDNIEFSKEFIRQRMAHVDHGLEKFVMDKQDLVAANMAVCADVFKKFHGFSASKDFYLCEDTELTHRLRKNGIKMVYSPEAVVYHHFDVGRLSKQSFLRQSYQWGKSDVILGSTDMPAWKYFLYCFRLTLKEWVKYCMKRMQGKSQDAFLIKCKAYGYWGRVRQIMQGTKGIRG